MIFYSFSPEEAVLQAIEYFKCGRDQLSVTEIKSPSRRMLGLVTSKGEFDIFPVVAEEKNEPVAIPHEDNDGYIEIISGEIHISDPVKEGRKATIITGNPMVEVLVNNEKINGQAMVSGSDIIEFKFINEEPACKIKVWLSDDKIQAFLKLEKTLGKNYFIKDVSRCRNAIIQLGYNEVQPAVPSIEQCFNELKKIGVNIRFVKVPEIQEFLGSGSPETIVAAEGRAPEHGVNSKIVYLFKNDFYRNPDFDTDKKINLMDHTIIPDVKIGDVLAVKVSPAIPGKDGVNVTGSVLKARAGIDIPIKTGSGAAPEDNNKKAVATINGRPTIKYSTVCVVPILTITKNINVETGNVDFEGDIVIKGNVEENMKISSRGNITVHGNVYHSSVNAGGHVKIYGHVLNSSICAGVSMVKYLCILPLMRYILKISKSMQEIVASVENNLQMFSAKGKLQQSIMQYKKEFDRIFGEISSNTDLLSDEDKKELDNIINCVKYTLTGIKARCLEDFNSIMIVCEMVGDYINKTGELIEGDEDVSFKYGQNSTIQANGNIIVVDKGCYQCNLMAKNSIIFKSAAGVVRGGSLLAGKYIKMSSAGTSSGITTYCKVLDKDGKIEADNFSNIVVNINENIKRL